MTDLDELDRAAIRRLLDGPTGPTGHLAGAAKRTAQRRAARRRTGLTASAAAAAVAAAGIPALLGGTVSLTAGPAGPGGAPSAIAAADGAAATAASLGMDTDGLAHEHFRIAVDCVRAAGVDAPLPAEAGPTATPARPPWLAQPGDGYGFASRAKTGAEPQDPERWEAAMYGQPRREAVIAIENSGAVHAPIGGCHGQATETLYGVPAEDYERLYQQVRPLPEQAVHAAVRDEGVADAARRWSSCLSDAGWDAGTPDDLDKALSPWLVAGGDGLARQESALYAADRRCRDRSGLQAAFDAAFTDAGDRVAIENRTTLAAYRRVLEHAHRIAAQR